MLTVLGSTLRVRGSNVEIVVQMNGVTKKNHCNVEMMNSFIPEIDFKEKRTATVADQEVLQVCPNNKFTCCSIEEMQPMLQTFKYTRELLLFKNVMLEKLLLYFNSVAKESFEKFTSTFTKPEKICTGEREYERLQMYYSFIQENSESVIEMVKKTTNQIINLYSSFLCTTCSPVNETIYDFDDKLNRPVIRINKRTCQNIIEFSLERKNLEFIWVRLNKIINAVMCKKNTQSSKKHQIETYRDIELRYYFHEDCLSEDQSFVDKEDCAKLCRRELKFFTLDDFRLYRVNMAIEALQETFELQLSKDKIRITDQLMQDEERKHPNSEVKLHVEKLSSIKDRYYFLKQQADSKYDMTKAYVEIEKYSGLISNSYEINMLYFKSASLLNGVFALAFWLLVGRY